MKRVKNKIDSQKSTNFILKSSRTLNFRDSRNTDFTKITGMRLVMKPNQFFLSNSRDLPNALHFFPYRWRLEAARVGHRLPVPVRPSPQHSRSCVSYASSFFASPVLPLASVHLHAFLSVGGNKIPYFRSGHAGTRHGRCFPCCNRNR
jgi:hypothetical protein